MPDGNQPLVLQTRRRWLNACITFTAFLKKGKHCACIAAQHRRSGVLKLGSVDKVQEVRGVPMELLVQQHLFFVHKKGMDLNINRDLFFGDLILTYAFTFVSQRDIKPFF